MSARGGVLSPLRTARDFAGEVGAFANPSLQLTPHCDCSTLQGKYHVRLHSDLS